MQLVTKKLSEIKPYKNNPRKNDMAVDDVAESIRQCDYNAPIVVDENNVILAGHTRLAALKQLGYDEAEVIVKEGLTENQKKKYRLLDNKTGEKAEWDYEKLMQELDGMDFDGFDFGFDDLKSIEDDEADVGEDKYTKKVEAPQYEITGENPKIRDLIDTSKTDSLIEDIKKCDIPDDVKEFLKIAAYRHAVFNYALIAEYYANATVEIQRLMEDSALVIIDFDDAIKKGYVKLTKALDEVFNDEA